MIVYGEMEIIGEARSISKTENTIKLVTFEYVTNLKNSIILKKIWI